MRADATLRDALGRVRSRRWLLVGGTASALVTVLALLGALAFLFVLDRESDASIGVAVVGGLLIYEVVLLVGKPAVLPGLYALVRREEETSFEGAVRIMWEEARERYTAVLGASVRARVAAVGYSVLLGPVLVAVVLVVATAFSVLLYATNAVQTPDPFTYATLLVFLGLGVWTVGKWPVALTELAAIDGESPSTAWRASARLVRRDPLGAGGAAALRLLLASLPAVVLLVSLLTVFEEQSGTVARPIAVFAAPVLLVKPIEGAVTAIGYDGLDASDLEIETGQLRSALSPDRLRPSARTALVLVLIVGLVLSASALRVTDVRPNPEPESPAPLDVQALDDRDPDTVYAVAHERTTTTSRAITRASYGGNWTDADLAPGLKVRYAVDYPRRAGEIDSWFGTDDSSWDPSGSGYFTDGLAVTSGLFHDPPFVLDTRRRDGATVSAGPQFPALVDDLSLEQPGGDATGWTTVERSNGSLVLDLDDPAAVAEQTNTVGDRIEHRNGSRIRVRIDESSQRITSVTVDQRYVVYETDEREAERDRHRSRTTVRYEYDPAVERPEEIGSYPWGYVWDLVYY